MDLQSPLRTIQIERGKASTGRVLGHFMGKRQIGTCRVDTHAEQSSQRNALQSGPDMGMCHRLVAMLEDLDADDQSIGPAGRKSRQVAMNQAVLSRWKPLRQLRERNLGDIEAREIEAIAHQWQIVAAIAAPDIETFRSD
ncbi:hypothetical protein VE25_17595 [Devosia geojensis]|uniref:Uncharacterized protein n=1 Tax=Devosia geojensis TaxID=443610 RepID=A0A0F5FP11_9HYPH|nr:hypothetical protein VE25_17595 [Devosia geojensis]